MYLQVAQHRFETNISLERGVLADMKGEPSAATLKQALKELQDSRAAMDTLSAKLERLRQIEKTHPLVPEYVAALDKILKDHPPIERVSLSDSRFANVARGTKGHEGPLGSNLDDILQNLSEDLDVLKSQADQTVAAFRDVLPMAEHGGFAAMVLSGRAPFPERMLQSGAMTMTYARYFHTACAATIAADMETYPKGLEWLKKPVKGWKGAAQ
jgi:hypothetical protein